MAWNMDTSKYAALGKQAEQRALEEKGMAKGVWGAIQNMIAQNRAQIENYNQNPNRFTSEPQYTTMDMDQAEAVKWYDMRKQMENNNTPAQINAFQPEYTESVDNQVAMAPGLAATLRQGGSR